MESKKENNNMSTPETDKPRVQLEKMTPPSNQIHKKQLKPNPDT